MFGVLKFLLWIPCLTAVVFYLYSIRSSSDLFSGVPTGDSDFAGPVSILKPLRGIESDAYQNLASFCGQVYPEFQILFGVGDEEDPSVEVVRRIIHDFPDRDIQLVVCRGRYGTNPKVSSMIQMEAAARHPFLLLSDSDIRVGPDYLKAVMRPFGDTAVGGVTCMGRSRTKGFASIIEALRISTEFCPGVLVARRLEGIRFGLGSTIVIRRQALEDIGGFRAIADFLADDFQLGALVSKAGWKMVLSDYVVEHRFSRMNLHQVIRRQVRWARGIRVSRPWSYAGLLFSQGVPMSLLFLLAAAGSAAGWAVFALTWAARLGQAHRVAARHLKDPAARKFLWLVPVQDIISFAVWCACFFGNVLEWRGEYFRLTREGKLIPLSLRLQEEFSPQQRMAAG